MAKDGNYSNCLMSDIKIEPEEPRVIKLEENSHSPSDFILRQRANM